MKMFMKEPEVLMKRWVIFYFAACFVGIEIHGLCNHLIS
jgi:hypothetical protein